MSSFVLVLRNKNKEKLIPILFKSKEKSKSFIFIYKIYYSVLDGYGTEAKQKFEEERKIKKRNKILNIYTARFFVQNDAALTAECRQNYDPQHNITNLPIKKKSIF